MYSRLATAGQCRWAPRVALPQIGMRTQTVCARYATRSGQTRVNPEPKPSRLLVLRQGRHESTVYTDKSHEHDRIWLETTHSPPAKVSVAAQTKDMTRPPRIAGRMRYSLRSMVLAFLPTDYKNSVTAEYLDYTKWQFLHNVLGSASGVLATQAMLYAMGLGAGALPLSAAINWVIKDGFGQLGGVVYATMVGQKFDSDPKHQRFWSAVWLQTATWLEMLTPLFPHAFLAIGSVANIGKNISWLAMSATKASINKTFCRKENLGDVTAKHGSQATAAGLVGTALGVVVGATMDVSVYTLIVGFVPISLASLWGNYQSLLYTVTPTLNVERARLMLQDAVALEHGRLALDSARLLTPRQVSRIEKFMREIHNVEPQGDLPGIVISADIGRLYRTLPWTVAATSAEDMAAMVSSAFQPRGHAWNERYYIGYLPRTADGSVYLWFGKQATDTEILLGFYHAMAFRRLLGSSHLPRTSIDDSMAIHTQSYQFAKQTFADACTHITDAGWDTSIVYFAKRSGFVGVKRH